MQDYHLQLWKLLYNLAKGQIRVTFQQHHTLGGMFTSPMGTNLCQPIPLLRYPHWDFLHLGRAALQTLARAETNLDLSAI